MLTAVLASKTLSGMERQLDRAQPHADCLEFRLDYLESLSFSGLAMLRQKAKLPVIFTLRRKDQGGCFEGSEDERLSTIEALTGLAPDYLDIEYDVAQDFVDKLARHFPAIKLISSWHDFTSTPDNLEAVLAMVGRPNTCVSKIVTMACSGLDALRVLNFAKNNSDGRQLVAHAMGDDGVPCRVLGPIVGNYFTYASVSDDSPAPGMLSLETLTERYRIKTMGPNTQIYSLLGDPVFESAGPAFHNESFAKDNRAAVYTCFRLTPDQITDFFGNLGDLPFSGFSITMPLKETLLSLASEMDETTRTMGAANTLTVNGSLIAASNTDGIAALDALEDHGFLSGKTMLLLGAGGAAKAIAFEAVRRGMVLTVVNRTGKKAEALAEAAGGKGFALEDHQQWQSGTYYVLVNTTPNGLQSLDFERLFRGVMSKDGVVMDACYHPPETACLLWAKGRGLKTISGLNMFTRQAQLQQNIWFGKEK